MYPVLIDIASGILAYPRVLVHAIAAAVALGAVSDAGLLAVSPIAFKRADADPVVAGFDAERAVAFFRSRRRGRRVLKFVVAAIRGRDGAELAARGAEVAGHAVSRSA